MNSEFNDMERMFQEGLQNYEVPPPAHVWSNIQKRKRKGLLLYKWRAAAILLLLCITGVTTYYLTKDNNEDVQATTVAQPENTNTNSLIPSETENSNKEKENSNGATIVENKNANNTSSNSVSETPNIVLKTKKNSNVKTEKIINDDITTEENEIRLFDVKDMLLNITSKDRIKLSYLIYPSLMQYIYSTKRIGKKYIKDKEVETDKLGYKFSLEVVGGPAYAFRKLSGEGDLLRDESEKGALGTQTGLKLNYHFNPSWSLQLGLIYENRHENLRYNKTEVQDKLTVKSRQVTIFHPVLPPRTITVIDSFYSKENVEYKFNSTNKYQTFSIPVVMGYNFGLGRMQYRISAGPLFNIYSINTAKNLVRNGDDIEIAPYKESSKVKTSFYGAVAILYPLNQNYNAFTEVSYYSNLSNRLNNETVLRQRNYGFNLNIGLKINLIK